VGYFISSYQTDVFSTFEWQTLTNRFLGGPVPELQLFLTGTGAQEWTLFHEDDHENKIYGDVDYGWTGQASVVIDPPGSNEKPWGISPFGTFYIDAGTAWDSWEPTGTGFDEADEVVVVMEIDVATSGGPPVEVSKCTWMLTDPAVPRPAN
jgi:hypothetical protein